MSKLKSGKIQHVSNTSNIFATTIQLLIHMNPLIDDRFEYFLNNPSSNIIPAIIDISEQMKSNLEYLDINPFIHAVNKRIDFKESFAQNFSYVLNAIFCEEEEKAQRRICFNSLYENTEEMSENAQSSYIFDILLERNESLLSDLIQSQWKAASFVSYQPSFLFFRPTNNKINWTQINDSLCIKKTWKYTLSIIVVKKNIKSKYPNYVLFILKPFPNKVKQDGKSNISMQWLRIEDDKIIAIAENKTVYKEIANQEKYQIELFGYCKKPEKFILPFSQPEIKKVEKSDLDKFRIPQFFVTLVKFNSETFNGSYTTEKFDEISERDKYLQKISKKEKSKKLLYDSRSSSDLKDTFDKDDHNLTVYLVNESDEIERPIQVLFCKYCKNLGTIEEEKMKASKAFFRPTDKINKLFEYAYTEFSESPKSLYLINDAKKQKLKKTQSDDEISNISDSDNPIFICYIPDYLDNNEFDENKIVFNQPNYNFEIVDTLTICRYLKTKLFDKDLCIKITEWYPKSKIEINIKHFIERKGIIRLNNNNEFPKNLLIYHINNLANEFTIDYCDKQNVSSIPRLINLQRGPKEYRICVIFDINDSSFISFDPNEEGFPFAIEIDENELTIESVKKSIANYLILGNLPNLKNNPPSIYKFIDGSFIEIVEDDQIPESNDQPIFYSWNSKPIYDDVIRHIKDHIKKDGLNKIDP